MPETFTQALRALSNPEYQYLLWQPIMVHGLILSALFTLGSLVLRQRRAAAFGLLLLGLCSLAVIPYLEARSAALPAIQAAHTKYDSARLSAPAERLSSLIWVYQTMAAAAGLAMLLCLTKTKAGLALAILSASAGLGLGVWGLDGDFREASLHHPNLGQAVRTRAARPVPEPAPVPVEKEALPAKPISAPP